MKKLHDLLVLKITQEDKERKKFPLVKIVGRRGIKWEPEYPVDKGWVDIYVHRHGYIETPYAISVETGYDFSCSKLLQQNERFKRALTIRIPHARSSVVGFTKIVDTDPQMIYPKLCIVIPKDFSQFIPLFKPKEISVFLWEGKLEWKCKKCGKTTLKEGPWKPSACVHNSSHKERSLLLVGLKDFKVNEAYRVP